MKKNSLGFFAALIVVVVFPVVFFLFFDYQHKHRPTLETDRCLPIYGPKEAYMAKDSKGREYEDTAYFSVPRNHERKSGGGRFFLFYMSEYLH